MRRVLGLVGLVFVLCGFAFGQASNCPKISVDTYGGVRNPGEIVPFTVAVDPPEKLSKLKYFWTLDKGTLLSGQNTNSIVVKLPEDDPYSINVTATVTITGLPDACPNTFSENFVTVIERGATILDEFIGPLERISNERFGKVIDELKADENSRLFAFIYGGERTKKSSFTQRRTFLIDRMKKAGVDPARVTFEFSKHNPQYDKEMVIVWLVPLGADDPRP